MFHTRCYTSITVFTRVDGGAALAADSSEGRCWVTTRIDSSRMWQQAADQCRYCTVCCVVAVAFLIPCKMCPFLHIFHHFKFPRTQRSDETLSVAAPAPAVWQRRRPEPGGGEGAGAGLGGGALGGVASAGGRLSVYRVTPSQQQQQQQQHESVAAQLRRRVSRVESLRKLLLGASHLDTRLVGTRAGNEQSLKLYSHREGPY